jgi:hypothetical protein
MIALILSTQWFIAITTKVIELHEMNIKKIKSKAISITGRGGL